MDAARYVFFFAIIVFIGGAALYLARRMSRPWWRFPRLARVLKAVMVCAGAVILCNFFLPRLLGITIASATMRKVFDWIAYLGIGILSYFLVLFLMWDGTAALIRLSQWVKARVSGKPSGAAAAGPERLARRKLFSDAMDFGVMGLAGTLAAFGFSEARRTADVVEVALPVAGLPIDLRGFRIVQITDIHVGQTIERPYLQAIVDKVNSLDADIIAITGDTVDGLVAQLRDHVSPFGELKARLGVYFVTGNHEYFWNAREWCEEFARLGIVVLNNAHRIVTKGDGRILLAGVTDLSADRFDASDKSDPHKAIAGAPPSDFRILLAHQPNSAPEAARAGFDLQLSGHTHGGQFWPWVHFIGLAQRFVAGLYPVEKMWLYVSRGTGYWGPPMRLGSKSEITVISLYDA